MRTAPLILNLEKIILLTQFFLQILTVTVIFLNWADCVFLFDFQTYTKQSTLLFEIGS